MTSRERTATRDEWDRLVADVEKRSARVAQLLRNGASFTGPDGVRIHPPLGLAVEPVIVRKTTVTAPARPGTPAN